MDHSANPSIHPSYMNHNTISISLTSSCHTSQMICTIRLLWCISLGTLIKKSVSGTQGETRVWSICLYSCVCYCVMIHIRLNHATIHIYYTCTSDTLKGLTSPKPERGCVKTDCFDEALCHEYDLHSYLCHLSSLKKYEWANINSTNPPCHHCLCLCHFLVFLAACAAPSCTATSLSAFQITMTTTSLVKPGNNDDDDDDDVFCKNIVLSRCATNDSCMCYCCACDP